MLYFSDMKGSSWWFRGRGTQTQICMLQYVLVSVSRSERSRDVLDELNVIWFITPPLQRRVESSSAGRDQTQSGNIKKAIDKIKTVGGGEGRGGGVHIMREVKGHRCSKTQMPDVSHYTASPADQDIIFIQPEVPFMLIGATDWRRQRRRGQGWEKGGGCKPSEQDQRWDVIPWRQAEKRDQLVHVYLLVVRREGGGEQRWQVWRRGRG